MRKILRLAKREYLAAVKTKGFLIGLILAPIFMGGGFLGIFLLSMNVDVRDRKIAVIDLSGLLSETLSKAADERNKTEIFDKESGKKIKPAYIIENIKPDKDKIEKQRLELSDRVRQKKIHAFLEIGPEVAHPGKNFSDSQIAYHSENSAMDDVRGWLTWPINNQLRKVRLADAGLDESSVKDLFAWMNIEPLGLVSVDTETGAIKDAKRINEAQTFITPIILMMLLFMMIMMGAVPLLSSVMEEKTQRIAEVLLGSITPFEFMMGKMLGGIGVSLTGSLVYVLGGIISISKMGLGEYIPYHILPWFFTYMLLSLIMFGASFAALGSACSEPKDAQSLSTTVMLPIIIPMFIMTPVIKEPLSMLSTGLSLFPPFTPFLMLLRQSTLGGVPTWQPWLGLLGILLFTVICVWAGGRIFRVGILMQGESPKLSNILRWAIKG